MKANRLLGGASMAAEQKKMAVGVGVAFACAAAAVVATRSKQHWEERQTTIAQFDKLAHLRRVCGTQRPALDDLALLRDNDWSVAAATMALAELPDQCIVDKDGQLAPAAMSALDSESAPRQRCAQPRTGWLAWAASLFQSDGLQRSESQDQFILRWTAKYLTVDHFFHQRCTSSSTLSPDESKGVVVHCNTVEQALAVAQSERKLLVVYFHSDVEPRCLLFSTDMATASTVRLLIDTNCLLWPVGTHTAAGEDLVRRFRVAETPSAVVVLARDEQQPVIVGRVQSRGVFPVDEFFSFVEQFQQRLGRRAAPLDDDQLLIRQQDEEYLDTLQHDRQLLAEQLRRDAEQQRQRQERDAEQQLRDAEQQRQRQERDAKAARLPAEPEPSTAGDVVHVAVLCPNSVRLERRFRTSDAAALLYDFVDSALPAAPLHYGLECRIPRALILRDSAASLADYGIVRSVVVILKEALSGHSASSQHR